MTRARPVSSSPSASRNSRAFGLVPSCATSASMAAEIDHGAGALAPRRISATRAENGIAGGGRGLLDVADVEHRLGGQQLQPAQHASCSSASRIDGAGRLALAQRRQDRLHDVDLRLGFLVAAAWPSSRSGTMRRSRLSRSASISSVSTVSASRTGSIEPSTWVTSASSKQRSTWTMASTSRMLARNWLPRPSPLRGAAHQAGDVDEFQLGRDDLGRLGRSRPACRAAGRAPRRGRHWARWCRTDSSPPAPPRSRSAR